MSRKKNNGRKQTKPDDAADQPSAENDAESNIESTLPVSPANDSPDSATPGTNPPMQHPATPDPGDMYTLPMTPAPEGSETPGQTPPAPDPGGMYTLPMTPPDGGQFPPGQTLPPQQPAGQYPGQYPGQHPGQGGTFPPAPMPGTQPPAYPTPPPGTHPHTPTPPLGHTTPPSTHPYHQPSYPPAPALPPTTIFANRFEIIELLGEGGMGQVFRVRDRQIENSEAALKVLHPKFSMNPQFRDLFFKEINNAKQFVSEYVTQVRDTGLEEGRLFLTMDLVSGEPLRSLIDREQSLDARHALEITRQTLMGLSSGHEKGLIHRDIKPPNIMLVRGIPKTDDNPFGVGVRLLDFGIAAVAEELGEDQIAGTPLYMSPEQASGQKLDARSDLFSLGNVLFEMISGSRLFAGKTMADITTSVLNVQVGPRIEELEHLSPAIRKILSKALEKDRKKRFQSAEEFIAAIEKSSAYRMPKGAPAWMSSVMVLSLGAAAVLGFLLFQKTIEQTIDTNDKKGWYSPKEHAAALALKQQTIDDLEGRERVEVADSVDQGDNEERILTLTSELDDKKGRLKSSLATVNRLEGEITQLDRDLVDQTALTKAAEKRNLQWEHSVSEDRKKAASFDLMVSLVTKKDGLYARRELDRIQGQDYLSPEDHDGGTFLEHLVLSSESLHLYEQTRDPALLTKAASFRDAARASHDEFLGLAVWLATPDELDGEPPARRAPLVKALETLDEQIATALDAIEADTQRKTALAASFHYGSDFNEVQKFGTEEGFAGLASFFEDYDAEVYALVEQDGRLLRNRLFELPHLPYWGTELAKQVDVLDTEATRRVRWLWEARAWYEGSGPAVDHELDFQGLTSEPSNDWRLQLALQMAMADLDSAAVPSTGRRNVYRDELLKLKGQLQWVVYAMETDNGQSQILRKTYDAAGKDPVRVLLKATFANRRFLVGSLLLDLTQLDSNVSVVLWSPKAGEAAPSKPLWSRDLDTDGFASDLASTPVPCLVVKDGANEFWYSPRYGLVREVRPGKLFRDLVETN